MNSLRLSTREHEAVTILTDAALYAKVALCSVANLTHKRGDPEASLRKII